MSGHGIGDNYSVMFWAGFLLGASVGHARVRGEPTPILEGVCEVVERAARLEADDPVLARVLREHAFGVLHEHVEDSTIDGEAAEEAFDRPDLRSGYSYAAAAPCLCVVGPRDSFGQSDLHEAPHCPLHGTAPAPKLLEP